jgi:hypothetical protein
MNKDQKTLIKLLNCAIRKESIPCIACKGVNWDYIISESQEHNIYTLLYPVIRDFSQSAVINQEFKEEWKKNTFNTSIYMNNQIVQMSKVFKEFNKEVIPVIALKGLILRNLYPYPDLRTMSDADIFIHKQDIEKVSTILINMGYVESKEATAAHLFFSHKCFSPIELHWKLADTNFIKDTSPFESKVWTHAVTKTIGDASVLCLGTEDFLMHLCLHMAVHIRSSGFGLRQLCDLLLLVEKEGPSIDWENFLVKIRTNGIEKFTTAIFNVCNILFDLQIPKVLKHITFDETSIKMLLDDIFDSGVFGHRSLDRTFGNNLLNSHVMYKEKNSNRIHNILLIICPPINSLSNSYSYAKKYKILAPIAWIQHFFAGLFNRDYKFFDKLNFFFFSTSTFKRRSKLIKNLEL